MARKTDAPKSLRDYLESGAETQEELAARLGISQAHVSRIAAGASCSLDLAKAVARLTGVPLESIGSQEGAA